MGIQHFFKQIFNPKKGRNKPPTPAHPHAPATRSKVPGLSVDKIPRHVLSVVDKLNNAGFKAYLVGGCVRDLLTGMRPKDFDVATDATPHEVKRLFRNSRLIGRRFLLIHVFFGEHIVEVATFRGNTGGHTPHRKMSQSGQILQDNLFGTIEEDALRRDFTINALFYDARREQVIDYTHGLVDIEQRLIRLIGDPTTRFREDPIRMLRALRFAAKLGFKIEAATEAPLSHMGNLLMSVPSARLFEETVKLFTHGYAVSVLEQLRTYGFDTLLLPDSVHYSPKDWMLIQAGLQSTDERYHAHKSCSAAFLIALLLFGAYRMHLKAVLTEGEHPGYLIKEKAMREAFQAATRVLAIPKRIVAIVRSIWHLQYALVNAKPTQVERIIAHTEFRPAFDLLWLRAHAGEPELLTWANWWKTHYGSAEERAPASTSDAPMKKRGGFRRRHRTHAQG